MLDVNLRDIAMAQCQAYIEFFSGDPPELSVLLDRALDPDDVRRAILKENPILRGRRAPAVGDPSPQQLREEAASVGLLDATPFDMNFRRLYPALDLGVYCASHSMGKPSIALIPMMEEHLGSLGILGIETWEAGGWLDVLDGFRAAVAALVGGDLIRGDVIAYDNFSDGLSSLLFGLQGRLVTTEGHFTTAHYIHDTWAERTESEQVRIPCDENGCVPAQRVIDALTPDTEVVSLSHAFWRNGYLQDIYAITEAMMDVCPDAALLLDGYQTLGTVPLSVGRLPMRSAVLGGGIKQLRAGTGTGFAWVSHPLLESMQPDRLGWWAHRDPMSFSPTFEPGPGGARFRTGTPGLMPMVALITELQTLSTAGDGNLATAIKRARLVTSLQMDAAATYARELGLDVAGPTNAEQRAAFMALRVKNGEDLVQLLRDRGVIVDYRPDTPGASEGHLRLSANSASFAYESLYAIEQIADLT